MINNFPLGHLKISEGDLNMFLSYIQNCIENNHKAYCIPLHITKYELSKEDKKLRDTIESADIVVADGAPICWLSHRMGYKKVSRVAGIDFAEAILAQSKKRNWSIYLLGARSENLLKAQIYIKENFDEPKIVGSHHGYFSSEELKKIIHSINSLKPDILLLGLGMPQKEYFIHDYFKKIAVTFWLPVGGSFDIWAQTKKRSPFIIQRLGLEWLQRSLYNKKKAKNVFKYGFSFMKSFFFPNK